MHAEVTRQVHHTGANLAEGCPTPLLVGTPLDQLLGSSTRADDLMMLRSRSVIVGGIADQQDEAEAPEGRLRPAR